MDPNIFALIIARDGTSSDAIRDSLNRNKFVDKNRAHIEGDEHNVRRLELRFDRNLPKSPSQGWQFGTSADSSDIIVFPNTTPETRQKQHFRLSITKKFKIQIQQLSPNNVVSLTHRLEDSGKESPGGLSRTTSTYDRTLNPTDSMVIRRAPWEEQVWVRVEVCVVETSPYESATYEIIFPNHTQNLSDAYRKNLERWIAQAEDQDSDSEGGFTSTPATPISHTPFGSIPVFRRTIGSGGYGVVQLWVDLKRGDTAAMKTLHEGLSLEGPLNDFKSEIELMKGFNHAHIIKLFRFELMPRPRLLMPYYRLGNIAQHNLRPQQYVLAFQQLLEAIRYLHVECHVAHRDLKPMNILVDSLDPIHIVISDFGLAKLAVSTHMKSIVGTSWYRAPEMFSYTDPDKGYQCFSVDIWSAGVIMLEWAYVLPKYPTCPGGGERTWTPGWIKAVLAQLSLCRQERDTNGVDLRVLYILDNMLVGDAKSRYNADKCLEQGYKSNLFTPPPSSHSISKRNVITAGHLNSMNTPMGSDSKTNNSTTITGLSIPQSHGENGRVLRPRGPDGKFLKKVVAGTISKKSSSRFFRQSAGDLVRSAITAVRLQDIVEGT